MNSGTRIWLLFVILFLTGLGAKAKENNSCALEPDSRIFPYNNIYKSVYWRQEPGKCNTDKRERYNHWHIEYNPKQNGLSRYFRPVTPKDRKGIPFWKYLNKYGHKVGIVNIPTTYPADKVDGFFYLWIRLTRKISKHGLS